jgi:hypothetical protein
MMRSKSKIFKFLMCASFLFGCSGGAGLMNGIMQSWQGSSVDEVISQWGFPHEEKVIAGRKILVWHRNMQALMPLVATTQGSATVVGNTAFYGGTTTYTGGGVINGSCVRILEVDDNNVVKSWQWEGNNCPFLEMGAYSNWRKK